MWSGNRLVSFDCAFVASEINRQNINSITKKSRSPIYAPVQLIGEIKKYNEVFRDHSQQDSVEFLRVVLDKLHEELPYPPSALADNNTMRANNIANDNFTNDDASSFSYDPNVDDHYNGCGTSSFSSNTTRAPHRNKRRYPLPTSVISNIFQGYLESRIKCLRCNQEFLKEDHFYDLPIQIDKKFRLKSSENDSGDSIVNSMKGLMGGLLGTLRLQDCLAAFCATEKLEGKNRYKCDICKKLTVCQKTLRITRLPETLCIQLKRFRYSSHTSKIGTHVQFPMEDLEMGPYCKDSSLKSTKDERDVTESTKYNLYGFIHHRGGSGSGHYIAYAQNPIDGNWYEYDDTKSVAEISRLEAYVLFYRRTSPEKDVERKEIKDRIKRESSAEHYWISRLWFNRWRFMTTPGPISNYDFICPHESVSFKNYAILRDLVVEVPLGVYTTLATRYGTDGSPPFPVSNYASSDCMICQQEEILLANRRRKEIRDIRNLDSNTIGRGESWYLISAIWLRKWHNFIDGGPLPGPIDNTNFLKENGRPESGMCKGVDYRGVNTRVWSYFEHIYGGGPTVVR
ncbi:11163_t:CDS:10, partial [Acaulospora colombiana]